MKLHYCNWCGVVYLLDADDTARVEHAAWDRKTKRCTSLTSQTDPEVCGGPLAPVDLKDLTN